VVVEKQLEQYGYSRVKRAEFIELDSWQNIKSSMKSYQGTKTWLKLFANVLCKELKFDQYKSKICLLKRKIDAELKQPKMQPNLI
jgi:hypothetical protein